MEGVSFGSLRPVVPLEHFGMHMEALRKCFESLAAFVEPLESNPKDARLLSPLTGLAKLSCPRIQN